MTMMIRTVADFYTALIHGPYAWPGGYPCYWLMSDGEACAFNVGFTEAARMIEAIQADDNSGWRPVALDVNWEESDLFCAHTNVRIEPAYEQDKRESA